MRAKEVIKALEDFAPLDLQESYDNAGLTVGSPEKEVNKALLTVDVTEEIIEEAVSVGADMIISHHPLIFRGIKNITCVDYIGRSLIKAIKNDMVIYACHTNIDSVMGGVSYRMGEKAGLQNMRFLTQGNTERSGLGVIGTLDEPMELKEFLSILKSRFNVPCVRFSGPEGKVLKIAMCGGAGAEFINDAIREGADLYVSADFKYHDFFMAEKRISLADMGHFESEQFTLEIFYEVISKKLPNFAIQITGINSNPIKYL